MYTRSILAALALAIPAALAAAPTVTADLAAARSEAVALRTSADNLLMLARAPMKHSSEAHASELARARGLADRIGERLGRIDAQRADATPQQLAAMQAMDVELRHVARDVDAAITAFNARNGAAGLYSQAYQRHVRALYDDARALASPAPAAGVAAD